MADHLFDEIERVGQAAKRDQLAVFEPQEMHAAETERPAGLALATANLTIDRNAIAIDEKMLDLEIDELKCA